MSSVPLNDEESVAIFTDTFTKSFAKLDGTEQRRVLKRVHTVLESSAPERYIYEIPTGCDYLEIVREGNTLRLYTKLVTGVPPGNKAYNIFYLFYVDKHKYRQGELVRFDEAAKKALGRATMQGLIQLKGYLKEHRALDADDVQQLLDEGGNLS